MSLKSVLKNGQNRICFSVLQNVCLKAGISEVTDPFDSTWKSIILYIKQLKSIGSEGYF